MYITVYCLCLGRREREKKRKKNVKINKTKERRENNFKMKNRNFECVQFLCVSIHKWMRVEGAYVHNDGQYIRFSVSHQYERASINLDEYADKFIVS